uniref:Metalloendopeptidase n=1 Tax=Amphilophus citrinellus TaxID=61819 RepID=A0A3Q0RCS4_AMPCI
TDASLGTSEFIKQANASIEKEQQFRTISLRFRRNADPCTETYCKWPGGHYVIVPYEISLSYTSAERKIIVRGLLSFHDSTCIRFVPKSLNTRDYLYFFSGAGCSSYVGRQQGKQNISLASGCLNKATIQHEVLHALGFRHEQSRSDRDQHVQILTKNIKPGHEHNFKKVQTNNLGTSYDFKSVMQYSKYAFSKNRNHPTILAKSNHKLEFKKAKEMSDNDIARVNRLYKCSE